VVVLVGYGLWYRHTAEVAQLAAQIPAIPTELAPLAVPPKPAVTIAPPKTVAQAQSAPAPQPAATTAAQAATAPGPTTTQTVSAAQPATPPATAHAAPPAAAATPAAPQKTIVATADSWVEVQDATGAILFSKTLHAGDSWPVPNLPGLTMTAGNAGATLIADNGAKGAPLGALGTVIRKYALTAPAPDAAAPAPSPHAEATPPPATAKTVSLPAVYTPTIPAPQNPVAAGAVEGPSPSAPVRTN